MGKNKPTTKQGWKTQPGKITRGEYIPDFKNSDSRKVQDSKYISPTTPTKKTKG